jgi:hypothetical protein
MFSAGSAAIDADNPRSEPVADKNAAIGTFIQYAAVMTHITCASFLAAGG